MQFDDFARYIGSTPFDIRKAEELAGQLGAELENHFGRRSIPRETKHLLGQLLEILDTARHHSAWAKDYWATALLRAAASEA